MPELPEVETIKREFDRELVGCTVVSVGVKNPVVLDIPPVQFIERVRGAEFTHVSRRAKYLAINLSNGYSLIIHLKISGQLLYTAPDMPVDDATHIILNLNDGKQLRLRDSDTFAKVFTVKTSDIPSFFAKLRLGPEPLNPNFTFDEFRTLIRRHKRAMIKPLLINQHFISGIGSIYADEILFFAKVHPTKKVGDLTEDELHKIYDGIKRILPEAIAHHGTTTRAYRDLNGQKGEYQDYLKVHAKVGQPCPGCLGTVERIEMSGRGTYVCSSCQH
ncbi:MAG TPA: bifunctional DNA-formamidopyrimidine glycosylase/DNA-(apurinic or apyrimidinic site) lyase [Candidatus Aquicultor sp.]